LGFSSYPVAPIIEPYRNVWIDILAAVGIVSYSMDGNYLDQGVMKKFDVTLL
jgi:hypothetical protein